MRVSEIGEMCARIYIMNIDGKLRGWAARARVGVCLTTEICVCVCVHADAIRGKGERAAA